MRFRLALLAGLASLLLSGTGAAEPPAHYHQGTDGVILPDRTATPGATRQVTFADLCPIAHTKRIRHVTQTQKQHAYALYGATPKPGACCEVDHLVPLALGGSNADTNLWPQPYVPKPGAHEKDVVESFLHFAVCGGAITLKEAQQKISTDWYAVYLEMRGRPSQ